LPCNDDERDRIHVRRRNAGYGVGYTRAGSDERNAHFLRGSRVTVSSVDSTLLMPNEHVLDFILLEKLIVQEEHRAAGIPKDVLDPLLLQATHKYFGTGYLHMQTY
jgi:hypothetical protein